METLTIARSVWLRGEQDSRLLRGSDRKMCCLGIYLLMVGFPEDMLMNVNTPSGVEEREGHKVPEWLLSGLSPVSYSSLLARQLMIWNDSATPGEQEREGHIRAGFAEASIIVNFVE